MYIGDLINGNFSFNAPFRIIHYVPDENSMQEGRSFIVFDSTDPSGDMPFDICDKEISAINVGTDGILEIEYVDLIGDNY